MKRVCEDGKMYAKSSQVQVGEKVMCKSKQASLTFK